MYLYEQDTEFGVIKWAVADKGKKILICDSLLDKVAMGMFSKLDDFIEVDDSEYEEPTVDEPTEEATLTELQENQIKLSKSNLSTYLEENPIFSTVKYEEGRYYNVTLEKQYSLTDRLLKHNILKDSKGKSSYVLYWNSIGQRSEVWEYEELLELSNQIERYVTPLVLLQQEVELEIMKCKSSVEVLGVNINPYKEVDTYNETNTFN